MKAEKLSTEIAALERQSGKAKNAVLKKVLAKKIDKLKAELESITSEETAKDKIKKAKTKVNAMDAKEFNAYIKQLAKDPKFSFLKNMTSDEIVRDIKRTAKPVGWRFRGRANSKTPTKKDIKDKNNVYYEGRRNRSDVSRKIRLGTGGGVEGVDLSNYEDIEILESLYKSGNKWYANGFKMKHNAVGVGSTKEKALEDLDNHLSYVTSERYKDGGGVEEGIDLFEDYDNIPPKVKAILDKYAEKFDDDLGNMDYQDMADMHNEVYAVGYTFESGLDNEPYDLRPIGTKGKSETEEFKTGGGVKYNSEGEMPKKATYDSVDEYLKNAKLGDFIWMGKDINGFKLASKRDLMKVVELGGDDDFAFSFFGKKGKYTLSSNNYDRKVVLVGSSKRAEGGGVDMNDWDIPVIRSQFEEEEFEFKSGGVVKYYNKENEYRLGRPSGSIEKEILDKVTFKNAISEQYFVGSFGWKTTQGKLGDGYLYNLDEFDQNLTKDLKLKSGEKVFRYVNRTTAIGGMTPFIKINLEKGLLYFPIHSDNDDVMFETRGVNPLWINIIEDKMANGGGVMKSGDMYKGRKVISELGSYANIEDAKKVAVQNNKFFNETNQDIEAEVVTYKKMFGDREVEIIKVVAVMKNKMANGGGVDEYRKGGNITSIEKRVAEVNEMIKKGNELGIKVVDESTTWQSPMKYKPLKYSNGVLYIEYQELDLYKYKKGMGTVWETKKDKLTKNTSDYGYGDAGYAQKLELSNIAKMYRKGINHFEKYGYYADGGGVEGVDMNDWNLPVIRTQFEDEEFEYAEGGETGEPHRTKINGMMAKGGAIQHGLQVGDKIVADQFWENSIVVENGKTNKRAIVYLETGKRKEA